MTLTRSPLSVRGATLDLLSPAFSAKVAQLASIGRSNSKSAEPNFSGPPEQLELEQLPLLPCSLEADAAADLLQPLWDPRNTGSWSDWFRCLPAPVRASLAQTAVLELLCIGTMIGMPLLLQKILDSLAVTDVTDVGNPWRDAFPWIVGLAAMQSLSAILTNVRDALLKVNAQRVAAGLHQAIFAKYLRLGTDAKKTFPPGAVLNLTSTDVKYITNFLQKFHDIWSPPLQVLLIFGVLYSLISWAIFVGLGALVIMFYIQSRAASSCGDGIRGYVDTNDQRIGYVREILYGISAVKVQALEGYFMKKISAVRVQQLGLLKQYLVPTFCYFAAINQAIPGVTALVSFGAYALSGHPLEASRVFAALTLFNLIYTPAFKLTLVVNRIVNIIPSLKRIRSYMTAADFTNIGLSHSVLPQGDIVVEPPALALEIAETVFTWAKPVPDTLDSGEKREIAETQDSDFKLTTGTVQSNVLMQRPFKESVFATAVAVTCLTHDLAQLPGGDMTAIGEKGSNLSGGQKMRIALARAVYSNADVMLLDDPLAPLDTVVANTVFTECIRGELATKTVFLVTQRLQYLQAADIILFIGADREVLQGTLEELRTNSKFSSFVENHADDGDPVSVTANDGTVTSALGENMSRTGMQEKATAGVDGQFEDSVDGSVNQGAGDEDSLVKEEERSVGQVDSQVYRAYIKHAGGKGFLALLFFSVALTLAAQALIGVWLAWWSLEKFGNAVSQLGYLGAYALLTMLQIVLAGCLSYVMVAKSLGASESLHSAVLGALLHAPLSFFQSQPIGRVLSRFNRDIQVVDADVMNAIDGLVTSAGGIGGSLLTIFVSSPILIGSSTVRAYRLEGAFLRENASFVNRQTRGEVYRILLDSWVVMRLQLIFAPFTLLIGILAAARVMSASFSGLALSMAITSTANVYLFLWAIVTLEVNMNSVERLCHYINDIPAEEPAVLIAQDQKKNPPIAWPGKGHIEFQQVVVTFDKRQGPVLKGINLDIRAGERVGIVGRTGSGKSTLVSCLSRLVEPASGRIVVDGFNISQVPMKHLRQQVVVMAQEAVLFSGTVRENLDPNDIYDDASMWTALDQCGMRTYYETRKGLDESIDAHGGNLSTGMRQLLAAARALLAKPSILIVDEATASMDPQSDKTLRNVIDTCFPSATIISIAHRVESLLRMDRIVVLADGLVVSSGTPRSMLEDPESDFYKLAVASGHPSGGGGETVISKLFESMA
ncbi:hypothetical protein HDU88_005182 [Geranomyces variabilis]|nr:hypothetical protein HDU88_005182 [Geranomyces variabilis]